jgi:hypothetical protein
LLTSRLCTEQQFSTAEHLAWCERIKEVPTLHRKQWEFCYIAQALVERGMLAPGRFGLGFGVGMEPLPSLFASFGCAIVATDLDQSTAAARGWVNTGQYAGNLANLNARQICRDEELRTLVSFRIVDMNEIDVDLTDFDFIWSSCALEHLGSLEQGTDFIYRAMECLRPGGVAVHTTEFNVTSDTGTIDRGGTVLYRKVDIEAIAAGLVALGHRIELDFDSGSSAADHYVDTHPYQLERYLNVQVGPFLSTSIGLIIVKGV